MTTETLTLADFLLARIAEDEAVALPAGLPEVAHRGYAKFAAGQDRIERLRSVTLGMGCPTCHADAGRECVAMTPPTHAPKPASDMHATRRELGAMEYRRLYGEVAQWNAPRVLAECAAKRRIVRLAHSVTGMDVRIDQEFGVEPRDEAVEPYRGDLILRALALPYSDHPDYRDEWRP